MAAEQTTPALLARCTWTNAWMRETGRPAEVFFARLTKTGKVTKTDKPGKAARFDSQADASAVVAHLEAETAKIRGRMSQDDGLVSRWEIVPA